MTLFDVTPIVPDPVAELSADQRRTRAAAVALELGRHPANGLPVDRAHTCGTCEHLHRYRYHNRRYLKCPNHRLGESHSAASDMRASWPACPLWAELGTVVDEPAADDPDGNPRNDHHVARDNELSGQNAEWARLEELGQ